MHKTATNRPLLSSIGPMPLWVAAGSQDGRIDSSNINQFGWIGEPSKKFELNLSGTPEKEKQSIFHIAFSAGENKNSLKESNVHDHQTNNFQQLSPSQQKNYFELELGLGQPMVHANYPLVDQCHGLFAVYAMKPMGRVMLPFNATGEEGPVYVNPKQYHGILRRRKMRAKEGMNRSTRDKPYIHESRHRHACRRARGAGGRFLNRKTLEDDKTRKEIKKTSDQLAFLSSRSSSSEVLQLDDGNLNSPKELSDCKGSNYSGSEVTSMYYSKEFDCFGLNHSRPYAFHSSAKGGSWVTASDGCCNLFKN